MTDRLISAVDDDASVRSATVDLVASIGFICEDFASAEAYPFRTRDQAGRRVSVRSCLLFCRNASVGTDNLRSGFYTGGKYHTGSL